MQKKKGENPVHGIKHQMKMAHSIKHAEFTSGTNLHWSIKSSGNISTENANWTHSQLMRYSWCRCLASEYFRLNVSYVC